MKTVGKILKLKKKLVETNPSQNLSMNYLSQLAQGIFLHAIKCQTSFCLKIECSSYHFFLFLYLS